jgi:hypothetical protein
MSGAEKYSVRILSFVLVEASGVPVRHEMPSCSVTESLGGLPALVAAQIEHHGVGRFQLMVSDLGGRNGAIAFGAFEEKHVDVAHAVPF